MKEMDWVLAGQSGALAGAHITKSTKGQRLNEANPLFYLVPETGVEPATFALRMRCLYDSRYLTREHFIVFSFIKQLVIYVCDVDNS